MTMTSVSNSDVVSVAVDTVKAWAIETYMHDVTDDIIIAHRLNASIEWEARSATKSSIWGTDQLHLIREELTRNYKRIASGAPLMFSPKSDDTIVKIVSRIIAVGDWENKVKFKYFPNAIAGFVRLGDLMITDNYKDWSVLTTTNHKDKMYYFSWDRDNYNLRAFKYPIHDLITDPCAMVTTLEHDDGNHRLPYHSNLRGDAEKLTNVADIYDLRLINLAELLGR